MNDPFPPKILVAESQGSQFTPAILIGTSGGLPLYRKEHVYRDDNGVVRLHSDRLTADTHRALNLIGKALESESGSLS